MLTHFIRKTEIWFQVWLPSKPTYFSRKKNSWRKDIFLQERNLFLETLKFTESEVISFC